jgi:hypothetical protein
MVEHREPRSDDDEIELLPGMAVAYAAMFGATVAGQVLGIALDAVLGLGSIGVPLGASVALEALAGARVGAAKSGGSLTPKHALRIAVTYSAGLAFFTVPLLAWMEVAHTAGGAASSWTPSRVALGVALFAVATLARWGLMVALSPRARR